VAEPAGDARRSFPRRARVARFRSPWASPSPTRSPWLATNIWLPGEEPNPILYAKKAATVRILRDGDRARGISPRVPCVSVPMTKRLLSCSGWTGWWHTGRWTSDDGTTDYLEALSKVRVPVLSIASLGDRYYCTPAGAVRFIKRVPPSRMTFDLVRRADDGGAPPDHMQLITTRAAVSAWRRVADFLRGGLTSRYSAAAPAGGRAAAARRRSFFDLCRPEGAPPRHPFGEARVVRHDDDSSCRACG